MNVVAALDPLPLIDRLSEASRQLLQQYDDPALKDLLVVGIHTGGVWVARLIADQLGAELGEVDISFHRDDILKSGLPQQTSVTRLPVTLDGRTVLLVDDVLHTGRTVRAALDELYSYGRPARVLLAVLFDRGGYELPIRADVVGQRLQLEPGQRVKLSGPEPLRVEVQEPRP